MAITIQAQLAKKVPIPGADFSSQQASITISAEVTDLNQVVAEAQRLYALAEQSVNAQLKLAVPQVPTVSQPRPAPATSTPSTASRPYPSKRAPAPSTASQQRYLDRLIAQTGADPQAICQQHQVDSLQSLSCKAAAGLIDELKSRVPA